MSDALASAIALSASRSKLEKQTAWNEIIPAALDEASVAPEEAANLLVDAVMYQLERDDSQHVLLHAIEDICRRSDVGEAFAKALAPRIISSTDVKSMSASAAVLALRASCAALRGNFSAIASNAAGFRSILLAQGSLLHRAREAGAKPALLHAADVAARGALRQPDASPKYRRRCSPSRRRAWRCALAGALSTLAPRTTRRPYRARSASRRWRSGCTRRPPPPPPPREKRLTFYASAVLGSSPSAHVHAGFAPLLAKATTEEWSGVLQPAVLKALKRTPDAAVASLVALLGSLPRDGVSLDASVAGLVEGLQPVLLSPTVPRADMAARAFGALGRRCTAAGALKACALFSAWKPALLSGSQQRAAYAAALSELAPAAHSAAASADFKGSKEATALVDALMPLAAKEAQEATRAQLLAAVGTWLPLAAAPTACVAAIGKGLADKSAELKRAYVGAVLAALQPYCDPLALSVDAGSSAATDRATTTTPPPPASAIASATPPSPPAALVSALGSLAEPLVALIKPALKKPPQGALRTDAIAVLVCLREGGGLCPALEKVCATEKVWAGVLKGKEAFLWQPDAIGAAGERELQLMLRLVTGLFYGHRPLARPMRRVHPALRSLSLRPQNGPCVVRRTARPAHSLRPVPARSRSRQPRDGSAPSKRW